MADRISPSLDHAAVLARVRERAGFGRRYALLLLIASGLAILGLLLSSPAILIGGMLIAPLTAPVAGFSFTLAALDWAGVRRSLLALLGGALLALLFPAAIALLSPLQAPTADILALTRPNLFQLLVAVLAALAAAYVSLRGRGETIAGAALATALLPPLAAAGYGLATLNWPIVSGALTLFVTNLIAALLTATLVARYYGFAGGAPTRRQLGALLALLLLFAAPLGWSLRQIAWETWATRTARTAITREFGADIRITRLDPRFENEEIYLQATVETDRFRQEAPGRIQERLETILDRPVALDLTQLPITAAGPSDAVERARQTVEREASTIAIRRELGRALEFAAGAAPDRVVVDPVARRATVQAVGERSLPDWQATEQRLAQAYPGWTIRLIPPIQPPPPIPAPETDEIAARAQVRALAWAIERWGQGGVIVTPRSVTGETAAQATTRAEAIAEQLRGLGLAVEVEAPLPADRTLERDHGLAAARATPVRAIIAPPVQADEAEEAVDEPLMAQG